MTIGTRARIAASRPYRLAVSRNVCTMSGLRLAQVARGCRATSPGPPHPGVETEHVQRRAGLANLLADRAGLVNAADDRLESRRQVPDQVEHHLLGAADHEGVREIDDASARRRVTTPRAPGRTRPCARRPSAQRDARRPAELAAECARCRRRSRRSRSARRAPATARARCGRRRRCSMIARAMSTSGVPVPLPTLYSAAVARRRLPPSRQQRVDRVVDVDVVAPLRAVAVDRQRLRRRARGESCD